MITTSIRTPGNNSIRLYPFYNFIKFPYQSSGLSDETVITFSRFKLIVIIQMDELYA